MQNILGHSKDTFIKNINKSLKSNRKIKGVKIYELLQDSDGAYAALAKLDDIALERGDERLPSEIILAKHNLTPEKLADAIYDKILADPKGEDLLLAITKEVLEKRTLARQAPTTLSSQEIEGYATNSLIPTTDIAAVIRDAITSNDPDATKRFDKLYFSKRLATEQAKASQSQAEL